jgi:hypothetical protein
MAEIPWSSGFHLIYLSIKKKIDIIQALYPPSFDSSSFQLGELGVVVHTGHSPAIGFAYKEKPVVFTVKSLY